MKKFIRNLTKILLIAIVLTIVIKISTTQAFCIERGETERIKRIALDILKSQKQILLRARNHWENLTAIRTEEPTLERREAKWYAQSKYSTESRKINRMETKIKREDRLNLTEFERVVCRIKKFYRTANLAEMWTKIQENTTRNNLKSRYFGKFEAIYETLDKNIRDNWVQIIKIREENTGAKTVTDLRGKTIIKIAQNTVTDRETKNSERIFIRLDILKKPEILRTVTPFQRIFSDDTHAGFYNPYPDKLVTARGDNFVVEVWSSEVQLKGFQTKWKTIFRMNDPLSGWNIFLKK